MGNLNIKLSPSERIDLPRTGNSVIGTIVSAPFNLLGAPQNAAFSVAAALRTGDMSYIENAVRAVIPGGGSFNVGADEVTGSDNAALNLGVSLFGDPILPVSGLGKLGKLGKAVARTETLIKDIKVAEKMGTATKDSYAALEKSVRELHRLHQAGHKIERPALTLGIPFTKIEKEIGNWDSVKGFIQSQSGKVIPSAAHLEYGKRINQLETHRLKAVHALKEAQAAGAKKKTAHFTERVAEYDKNIAEVKQLQAIESKGKEYNRVAIGVRQFLEKNKDRVKAHIVGTTDPAIQQLKDFAKTKEERQVAALNAEEAANLQKYDILRKAAGMAENEFNNRIIMMTETRKYGPTGVLVREGKEVPLGPGTQLPNVEKLTTQEAQDIANEVAKYKAKKEAIIKSKALDPVKKVEKKKNLDESFRIKIHEIKKQAEYTRGQFEEIHKMWGGGQPINLEEFSFIKSLTSDLDELVPIENSVRIAGDKFKDDRLSYVTRLLSPEALAMRKDNPTKFYSIMNQSRVNLGYMNKRMLRPDLAITEVNELLKGQHQLGFDFFDNNVVKAVGARRRADIKAVNQAAIHNAIVEIFGSKNHPVGEVTTSARSYLKAVGLTPDEIGGLPAIPKELRIPKSIADQGTEFKRILDHSFLSNKGLAETMGWMDNYINSFYRTGFTTFFPGFHHRNMVSNAISNAMAGVWKPAHYKEATKQLYNKAGKWFDEATEYGVFRGQQRDIAGQVAGTAAESALAKLPGGTKAYEAARKYGENIENMARLAHYIAKREAGLTPWEAVRSVNKYLFDYTKLTQTEQKVLKPLFLFYTWTRKNIPLMVNTAIENPQLVSAWNKLTNTNDDDVPDYLRSRGTIPLERFGGSGFVSDPGTPFQTYNLLNVDDVDPTIMAGVRRVADRVVTQLAPVPKLMLEAMAGRSSFTGKDFRDFTTTKELTQWLSSQLPTSRFVGTAQKAWSDDSWMSKGVNILTGMKHYEGNIAQGKVDTAERAAVKTGKYIRVRGHVELKREYREQTDDAGAVIKEKDEQARKIDKMLRELNKKAGRK